MLERRQQLRRKPPVSELVVSQRKGLCTYSVELCIADALL